MLSDKTMRTTALAILLANVLLLHAHARLGDTFDQAIARYGLPKKPGNTLRSSLLEGAKEVTFEMQGWRIRCALLGATDGREYIVREEYTKIWNSEVMKAGGSSTIKDFEIEAVLKGEAGTSGWTRKVLGKAGNDLLTTFSNQLAHSTGLTGTNWVREDGAQSCLGLGRTSIRLDLPQAMKYEAELKAINDARARSNVPKF